MKGIFTLNPSEAKYFLPVTFPWQGLFNPSAGFVIPKRGSVFPITGFSFPKWNSFNTPRDFSFAKWLDMVLIKVNFIPFAGAGAVAKYCIGLQLWSTFRNLSFGLIGTYFESCGILRKYVLRNSPQSKKLKGNLPIVQLVSHPSKKATEASFL